VLITLGHHAKATRIRRICITARRADLDLMQE